MQTRLLACLAGGFLGVVVASPISQSLNVSLTLALIGCALLGLSLGYVVSIFFDVFTASSEEQNVEAPTDKWSVGTIPGKNGGDDGARTWMADRHGAATGGKPLSPRTSDLAKR